MTDPRSLGVACVILCAAAGLDAQQITTQLAVDSGTPPARRISAAIDTTITSAEAGAISWVTVEFDNPDQAQHTIRTRIASMWGDGFAASRTTEVPGRGRATLHLPLLPNPSMALRLSFVVDGWSDNPSHAIHVSNPGSPLFSALVVADAIGAKPGWEAALVARASSTTPTSIQQRSPAQLPRDWRLLSGFDLIVVDGTSAGIDRELQHALRDYLRAGGDLLLYGTDGLAPGPLGELPVPGATDDEIVRGLDGFGRFLRLGSDTSHAMPGGPLPAAVASRFDGWLGEVLADALTPVAGPIDAGLSRNSRIPGLGEIPVRLFFVLLLLFAIAVGPVSYFYWWRRKRLPMLLLTVPGLGFATTVAILGYGLASEGFGLRGVIRSITLLDQAAHRAVGWAGRTIYPGLSPSRLRPSDGTLVANLEIALAHDGERQLSLDLDRNTIDGSLLPSRTPTTLATASSGTERARLRFQRRADGGVAVLAGPDLRPLDGGDTSIVLHAADGGFHVGDATRGLSRVEREDAARALDALLGRWSSTTAFDPAQNNVIAHLTHQAPHETEAKLLARVERAAALLDTPGTYVAIVASCPAVDMLGLEVEYLAAGHLVVGRLGAEDVID